MRAFENFQINELRLSLSKRVLALK